MGGETYAVLNRGDRSRTEQIKESTRAFFFLNQKYKLGELEVEITEGIPLKVFERLACIYEFIYGLLTL